MDKIKRLSNSFKRLNKTENELKDRRIRCIYCNKPIHIDNFAGVCKKGFICGNSVCLMQLAKEMKEDLK